jgi:shikimate kinase
MNVSFIGYRCSGKTTISKRLKDLLDWQRVEIDKEIENYFKLNIPEIIDKFGWDKFRRIEKYFIKKYSIKNKFIIDVGGGAILNNTNIKNLKDNGILIFLNCSPEIIFNRQKKSFKRPALTDLSLEEEIKKTLKERFPLYKKYSDYTLNSGLLSIYQCTHLSVYFLREHSILLNNNRNLFFKLKHA